MRKVFKNICRLGGVSFALQKGICAKPVDTSPDYSAELAAVIDSATISRRAACGDADHVADERVLVLSIPLGGAFIYACDVAERRIRSAFPELSDASVARGIRHLESRILQALTLSPEDKRRNSWVHGWANDNNNLSRL